MNQHDQQPKTLVIGYGNPLRGDDGVGQDVALAVTRWQLAHVSTLCVHQLMPELAATLVRYDQAFFVDATLDTNLSLQPIKPSHDTRIAGHSCDPRMLLVLAQMLYGYAPRAWWLTIPAAQFVLGAPLSSLAEHGIDQALELLRSRLCVVHKTTL